MTFAWQHFKAIEYGYKIESMRIQRDSLVEENHALRTAGVVIARSATD